MPTDAQISANRANAKKSTGPRTAAGKARSRANATKHGLTATLILPDIEDPRAFRALTDRYWSHYNPQGPVEEELVMHIVSAAHRIRRAQMLETEALGRGIDAMEQYTPRDFAEATPERCLLYGYNEEAASLNRLGAAESRLHRQFLRSMTELTRLQTARRREQAGATAAAENSAKRTQSPRQAIHLAPQPKPKTKPEPTPAPAPKEPQTKPTAPQPAADPQSGPPQAA